MSQITFTDLALWQAFLDEEGEVDGSDTKPNKNQKVHYHVLGEAQAQDQVIIEFPEEPTWLL